MKVSYSMVSTYLSCPYKYALSYLEGLRLKKPARPLVFGKDLHSLLENRYNKTKLKEVLADITEVYNDMPSQFQAELGENYIQDLKDVFNDYRKVWKGTERPIETEHEFMIELGKIAGEPIVFHGFVDEIYEGNKLGEHKTFSQQPNMSVLAMNTQVCLYSKAWELETGQRFERVQWDYIKSKPADYPIWLEKSGRFSNAKSNNITPFSWERACKERGVIDKDILNAGKSYEPNISNFYFRAGIEIVPSMVDTVWDSFRDTIKDMVRKGGKNKIKNVTRDCSWCNYRPICYAEFTGADVGYIIDTDYTIRERVEENNG